MRQFQLQWASKDSLASNGKAKVSPAANNEGQFVINFKRQYRLHKLGFNL